MSALRLIGPLGRGLRCQPLDQLLRPNQNCSRVLCAFITSKANMVNAGYQRPAPFPYKEKKYNWYYQTFDRTVDRFDDNTKVLVVDGPIAAGKSTFAKELAQELDMLYVPEPDFDTAYVTHAGYDLRQLNSKLPPEAHYLDVKGFSLNPTHPNAGIMQINMCRLRFISYIDAVAHLLHTGQGVVLDRSVYSDFVFMETMVEAGYMSKNLRSYYYEALEGIKLQLKQPHLIIYLDVPVDIVQKRIKERNREWEVNSPALSEKYLSTIEKYYKKNFLRDMSVKSEIMVYDWSNFGDVEVVVEDIERIDFTLNPYEKKFEDWRDRKSVV